MQGYIVVFATCPSKDEGKRIAKGVLDRHLVACVNLVPLIESMYWWEGKIEVSDEVLLIMKTKDILFPSLEEEIKRIHSYSVPEIIALPIKAGNEDYLNWIEKEAFLNI